MEIKSLDIMLSILKYYMEAEICFFGQIMAIV